MKPVPSCCTWAYERQWRRKNHLENGRQWKEHHTHSTTSTPANDEYRERTLFVFFCFGRSPQQWFNSILAYITLYIYKYLYIMCAKQFTVDCQGRFCCCEASELVTVLFIFLRCMEQKHLKWVGNGHRWKISFTFLLHFFYYDFLKVK